MSLGKQILHQLRLLADGQEVLEAAPATEPATKRLAERDGARLATLEIFDHDRYSVALRAIEVGGAPPAQVDTRAYLSASAAEIVRRLSYLEEPLAVWELDGGERRAELRSSPPQREGDEVAYWEVTLWAGEQPGARIMRYRWTPGMVEREEVAYPATFALVARMVDSLVESLEEVGE
jgi:hypothetical protein